MKELLLVLFITAYANDFLQNKVQEVVQEFQAKSFNFLADSEELKNIMLQSVKPVSPEDFNRCIDGEDPNYYHFFPLLTEAMIKPNSKDQTFSAFCLKQNVISISGDQDSFQITIKASEKTKDKCYDWYFVGTMRTFHFLQIDHEGTYVVNFFKLDDEDVQDANLMGIRIFGFCEGIGKTFQSLWYTLRLFSEGFINWPIQHYRPTYGQEASNVEFLSQGMGYTMQKRYITRVSINETEVVKSGDFLAIMRLGGTDPLIAWGTGGRIAHCAIAIWETDETGKRTLWVIESQGGYYWPTLGIQRNEWHKWLDLAYNAGFQVALLPLKQKYRDLFNETKVWEVFNNVYKGLPYGSSNFFLSFLDTPDQNLPSWLPPNQAIQLLSIVEKIVPKIIQVYFGEAFNKRLNTTGLSLLELELEAAKRGMTLPEVWSIREEDGWIYTLNKGMNYVCSAFTFKMYIEAGLFKGLTIQATEQTPKDQYEVAIFEKNPEIPLQCMAADPSLPYCQLLGDYRIDLGDAYSSIEPYDFMNERCPSRAPDYVRPQGC